MGRSVALVARRRNVITNGQQCAPLFKKSRIRIIEYRQDPTGRGEVCDIKETVKDKTN